MKKIFTSTLLMVIGIASFAQQNYHFLQNIAGIPKGSGYDRDPLVMTSTDPFKLCQALYEWDAAINNFKKTGNLEIEYEVEDGQDVFTTQGKVTTDDGEQELRIITYGGFNDIFSGEDLAAEAGDSTIIFAELPGTGLVPFIKVYNTFEQGRIITSEQLINFTLVFGIPLGWLPAQVTAYRYTADKKLLNKVTSVLDFFSGEFAPGDSTVYRYNGLGQNGEEKLFSTDDNGVVYYLAKKSTFTYNGDGSLDVRTVSDFGADGTELSRERFTYSYDNQDRQTGYVSEVYSFEGDSWAFGDKLSREFAKTLPLGFPTKMLFQNYIEGKWVNADLSTMDYCSTSDLGSIQEMKVDAQVTSGVLYLSGTEAYSDQARLSIFDMHGRKILSESGTLKSQYFLGDLTTGIYIIQIKDKGKTATKKLLVLL